MQKFFLIFLSCFLLGSLGYSANVRCDYQTETEKTPSPKIESITPNSGLVRGGMRVQIHGTGFTPGLKLWLGGTPCTNLKYISPIEMECVTSANGSGTVDALIKSSSEFSIKKNAFTFVPDLRIVQSDIDILTGGTKKISVAGGTPPFTFSVLKGNATINPTTGELTGSPSPDVGVVQVSDSQGHTAEVGYRTGEKMKVYPENAVIDPNQSIMITPYGGVSPYTMNITRGAGKFYPDRRVFIAPDAPGEATLSVSDENGTVVDVKITIQAPRAPTPRLLAVGDDYSCAIIEGSVNCWGSNGFHQLGNLKSRWSSFAIPVQSLEKNVQSIVAGMHHTCVIVDGGVKCWGDNHYGQLGNGTTGPSSVPVSVIGLGPGSGVLAIAAGDFHTCAATSQRVLCWGRNDNGQLGDGTTNQSSIPVAVPTLEGRITGLTGGAFHTCAIDNGLASCWGKNQNGQLGIGNQIDQPVPTNVTNLGTHVTAISAGRAHTCAVADQQLKCWGFNGIGNLGVNSSPTDPNSKNKNRPIDVQLSDVTRLASRQYHSCAISSGNLYCWGYNYQGQIGDSSFQNRWSPVQVRGLKGEVKDVATGNSHTCAMTSDGSIYCWGENYFGQLGNGNNVQQLKPVLVRAQPKRKSRH